MADVNGYSLNFAFDLVSRVKMCIVFSFAFIPNCGHHHRESVFSSLQQSRCSFFFFLQHINRFVSLN